jgi:hypothetical protein
MPVEEEPVLAVEGWAAGSSGYATRVPCQRRRNSSRSSAGTSELRAPTAARFITRLGRRSDWGYRPQPKGAEEIKSAQNRQSRAWSNCTRWPRRMWVTRSSPAGRSRRHERAGARGDFGDAGHRRDDGDPRLDLPNCLNDQADHRGSHPRPGRRGPGRPRRAGRPATARARRASGPAPDGRTGRVFRFVLQEPAGPCRLVV